MNNEAVRPFPFTIFIYLLAISLVVALGAISCQGQTSESDVQGGGNEEAATSQVVILATTTSTYDSGLLDVLVPVFEEETSFLVKIIAVGTGQALKMGSRGDADVLLVHAPAAEKKLVEEGSAIERKLIMHNDFILVGPLNDPADIKGISQAADAFNQVNESGSIFVSRGDDSGTHKRELAVWEESGSNPGGESYLESGQGMGATLRIASEKGGYTLTDRATYLALLDTLDLEILVEGDPSLLNPYHVMEVNPERWSAVNNAGARAFSDFLLSTEGQELIGEFGLEEFGMPLFIPDGGKSEEQLGSG